MWRKINSFVTVGNSFTCVRGYLVDWTNNMFFSWNSGERTVGFLFNYLKLSGNYMYQPLITKSLHILLAQCVCISRMILRVNSHYFLKANLAICLSNGDALCFLQGRNWIWKRCLYTSQAPKSNASCYLSLGIGEGEISKSDCRNCIARKGIGELLNYQVGSIFTCMCVTIDGVWIGEWIYWPLTHTHTHTRLGITSNYSSTADPQNSRITTAPAKPQSSI
jgi:hypothetical protein